MCRNLCGDVSPPMSPNHPTTTLKPKPINNKKRHMRWILRHAEYVRTCIYLQGTNVRYSEATDHMLRYRIGHVWRWNKTLKIIECVPIKRKQKSLNTKMKFVSLFRYCLLGHFGNHFSEKMVITNVWANQPKFPRPVLEHRFRNAFY